MRCRLYLFIFSYIEGEVNLIFESSCSGCLPFADTLTEEQQQIVETAAEVLYGLIHARFILTSAGMSKMVSNMRRTIQILQEMIHVFVGIPFDL